MDSMGRDYNIMKKLLLISTCLITAIFIFRYAVTNESVRTCPGYHESLYNLSAKIDDSYIKTSIILAVNERKEEGTSLEKARWWSLGFKDRMAISHFRSSVTGRNYAELVENYPDTFASISEVKKYLDFFEEELSGQSVNYEKSLCSGSNRVYFFGPENRSFQILNNSGGSSSISMNSELNQAAARLHLSYNESEEFKNASADILGSVSSVYIDSEYPEFGRLYFKSMSIVKPSELGSENVAAAVEVYFSSMTALTEGNIELFLDGYTEQSQRRIMRWFDSQKDVAVSQTLAALKGRELIGAIDGGAVVLLFFKGGDGISYEYLADLDVGKGYKLANFNRESLVDGFFMKNINEIAELFH